MKLALLTFFLAAVSLLAADLNLDPRAVIDQEGHLSFSDGSSIYNFQKDGTFTLEPVGESGRSIEGKWRQDAAEQGIFVIDGRWMWVNGLSTNTDYRTMKLWIYPLTGKKRTVGKELSVYDCYFVIDELIKKPAEAVPIAK